MLTRAALTEADVNSGPLWQWFHLPPPMKVAIPAFCCVVSAVGLPLMKLSKGVRSETNVDSYNIIDRPQYSEKLASICVKPSGVTSAEPHHLLLKADRIKPAYVTVGSNPVPPTLAELPSTLSVGSTFCVPKGGRES